ncbi:hypothetical protein BSKO_08804 [Bryopsis sp. KO-2023]|nr:hypothetical protein BSKO_08804 [Bryopsis sp. KO-2023]
MKRALPLFLSGTTQSAKERKTGWKRKTTQSARNTTDSCDVPAEPSSKSPPSRRKFVELKLEPSRPLPISQSNQHAKEKRRRLSRKEMAVVSDEQLMSECERILCAHTPRRNPEKLQKTTPGLSIEERNTPQRRRELKDDGKSECQISKSNLVAHADPPIGDAGKPASASEGLATVRSSSQAVELRKDERKEGCISNTDKNVPKCPQKKFGFAKLLAEIMSDESL